MYRWATPSGRVYFQLTDSINPWVLILAIGNYFIEY